ncbi:MAG: DegT/DnrJ/EryC1/StrS family aminotransferase [Candidatus Bathyarchaeota archaeon]|jgi:dTDP-4-amino-4,6-dideoxygalactose transaminase
MLIKSIPPVRPYFPPEDIAEIKRSVKEILKSGMLTMGKYTNNFEKEFSSFTRVNCAVAVNSGTSALEIVLRCIGIDKGDEVIVPTNTFTATAAAVFFSGGKPVLTDIDPDTLCITKPEIEKHFTSKTRAVIVVHSAGLVCPEIEKIKNFCKGNNLWLIEDAAHAHGSKTGDKFAGSLGDVGCFSFYPTKVITTGEGGMITTDNIKLANKAKIFRDQGKERFNSNLIVELGYNWRIDEISAAIGLVQLKRLSEIVEKRNKIAKHYDEELVKLTGIHPLKNQKNILNNYYKYIALLKPEVNRQKFKEILRSHGVKCGGEVYWPPLHMQPIYQKLLGTRKGDFPNSEDVCGRMIALPMYTQLTLKEVEYVVKNVRKVLSKIG